jgi:hypothetical protein
VTVITSGVVAFFAWTLSGSSDVPPPQAPMATAPELVELSPSDRRLRRERLATLLPGQSADHVEELMRRSDLAAAHNPDLDREAVARLLRSIRIPESEARAYHAAHPGVFSGRSFPESRLSVERILLYEKAAALLEAGHVVDDGQPLR